MVVVLFPAVSAKDDDARWGKAKKQIAAPARPHASSMADRCVVKRGQMASGNDSEQTRTLVKKDMPCTQGLLGGCSVWRRKIRDDNRPDSTFVSDRNSHVQSLVLD